MEARRKKDGQTLAPACMLTDEKFRMTRTTVRTCRISDSVNFVSRFEPIRLRYQRQLDVFKRISNDCRSPENWQMNRLLLRNCYSVSLGHGV